MTATAQLVRHATERSDFRHWMAALHYHGFTVTLHSPDTSPNGLYAVTAYGVKGRWQEMLRGTDEHLDDAMRKVAEQLGGIRLKAYAKHVLAAQAGALR